jgi:hypothetical protein
VYAREPNQQPVVKMNAIANEAVKLVKNNLPENAGIKDVKLFFNDQQHYILPYLPVELNIGELLNDSTLDDKTNKMEGPVSSLVQNIGNAFSKDVSNEEIKTKESLN